MLGLKGLFFLIFLCQKRLEQIAMLFNVILTIFFAIFSTAILSYISMAVMIGPWINSVIVIASSVILLLLRSKLTHEAHIKYII